MRCNLTATGDGQLKCTNKGCTQGMLRVNVAPDKIRRTCDGEQESRGLGDTIAKITTAIGIKPCGGCKDRQAALNKLVPYKTTE